MEDYFTRHAHNRMRLYEITREQVLQALENPTQVTEGCFEAMHIWKQLPSGTWLRITVKIEEDRRVIITITPKRKFSGGTHAN